MIQRTADQFKWNLTDEMAEHESILLENPAPSNIGKPQVINDLNKTNKQNHRCPSNFPYFLY